MKVNWPDDARAARRRPSSVREPSRAGVVRSQLRSLLFQPANLEPGINEEPEQNALLRRHLGGRRRRADDVGATGIIPTALADIEAALVGHTLAAALANIEAALSSPSSPSARRRSRRAGGQASVARVAPRVDGERAR